MNSNYTVFIMYTAMGKLRSIPHKTQARQLLYTGLQNAKKDMLRTLHVRQMSNNDIL